jgi:hypothetical protein
MIRFLPRPSILLAAVIVALGTISAIPAAAQFSMRPSLGLQTMWFNGDYPVSQPISPGNNRDLPLGGGMMSSNNGVRLQLELIPSDSSMIRIPVAVEYYDMSGKTTFSASSASEERKKRYLFRHDASLISVGAGVTANFFTFPSLYFGVEGKLNYLPATSLYSRLYYVDKDETLERGERTFHPSPEAETRLGLYLRVGTQLDFFEPFLLDFSLGYGAMNLALKETDPAKQRNLLIVDSERHDPELTIGYIGIGFSVLWKL